MEEKMILAFKKVSSKKDEDKVIDEIIKTLEKRKGA